MVLAMGLASVKAAAGGPTWAAGGGAPTARGGMTTWWRPDLERIRAEIAAEAELELELKVEASDGDGSRCLSPCTRVEGK